MSASFFIVCGKHKVIMQVYCSSPRQPDMEMPDENER